MVTRETMQVVIDNDTIINLLDAHPNEVVRVVLCNTPKLRVVLCNTHKLRVLRNKIGLVVTTSIYMLDIVVCQLLR